MGDQIGLRIALDLASGDRRVCQRPYLALVIAIAAVLGACSAWSASASADVGRLVVGTQATSVGFGVLELVDPISGAAQPFAGSPEGPASLSSPTWGNDASTIAYYKSGSSVQPDPSFGVVLKPVAGGVERTILPLEAVFPSWSPTSDEIAYWLQTQTTTGQLRYTLKVTSADGQTTRTVAGAFDPLVDMPNVGPQPPAWSSDGRSIAFAFRRGIVSVPAAGGPISPLVAGGAQRGTYVVGAPSYAPDGSRLAYLKSFENESGQLTRWQLIVRSVGGGPETPIADVSFPVAVRLEHGPQSWSPDSTQVAYATQPCTGTPVQCTTGALRVVDSNGSGDRLLLQRRTIGVPAWSSSGQPDLTVAIDTPKDGQEITGHASTPAERDAARLTGSVSSPSALSGWCFSVQTRAAPAPQTPSKADCNRVFESTSTTNGRTTARFSADLARLVATGGLKEGDNKVWVWGYGSGPDPAAATVTVKLRPNYFIKDVEVAQAISPELGPPRRVDPLAEDSLPIPWTLPSVAGFDVPLVAGKRTLLRIYVGDSQLASGQTDREELSYRVTGSALAAPVEGRTRYPVMVTAPDLASDQEDQEAAIDVWLPAQATPAGPGNFHVEVNPDQQADPECKACFPNGNHADLTGLTFEQGGSLTLLPVDVVIHARGESYPPSTAYGRILNGMLSVLPIRDAGLTVLPSQGTLTFSSEPSCKRILAFLEYFGLMQPATELSATTRWVGLVGQPPGFEFDCKGMASRFDTGFALFTTSSVDRSGVTIAVHELGHTLEIPHSPGSHDPPSDAVDLPYSGIGGVGYDADRPGNVLAGSFNDLMSYSYPQWTSPKSWQQMFEELARSGGPAAVPRAGPRQLAMRTATGRAAADAALERRRLVSGTVSDRKTLIFDSLVANARAPEPTGPVVGRLVGVDRRGDSVVHAPIHGTPDMPGNEAPPFIAALPASDRIAALQVRPSRGGKVLAQLKASKYPPRGKFVRLPKRATANKPLTVRWTASDRDRSDRLSVILQVRRNRSWQTSAMGPSRSKATVDPNALGTGKKLRLRLLVSDGFRTTMVGVRSFMLNGR